jgi:flavin-dependent dehydrogenase
VTRSRSYDVAVIGGGPAGLTAAIALSRRGARVVLFDAWRAANEIARIETIQARVKCMLMKLDAGHAIESIAVPAVVSRWNDSSQHEWPSILDPHGPPFHIERGSFRLALCTIAAEAGVRLSCGERARATPSARGWRVTHGSDAFEAAFLIVATGRNALPFAARISRKSVDRLVAVLGYARHVSGDCDLRLVIEAAPGGWWYRCPSPRGYQQIVFLSDADLVSALTRSTVNWFAKSGAKTELGQGLIIDEPMRIVAANTYCRDAIRGDNIVLIGDAAMAGDPLAGDGVSWAITSGLNAAEIIPSAAQDREAALAAYSDIALARFTEFLTTRRDTYGHVRRWPHSLFWSRRQRGFPLGFDAASTDPAARPT